MSHAAQGNSRVSVVIPSCNGERFIGAFLRSVAAQTRRPDEVILSDDQSTDGTCQTVRRFAEDSPFPVRLYPHRQQGITQNYLHALTHATGEIIFFADQDDVWDPGRIERYLEAFERHPAVSIVSSDSLLVDVHAHSLGTTIRGGRMASERLSARVNAGADLGMYLKHGLPIAAHSLAVRSVLKEVLLDKPAQIPTWWFEDWVVTVSLCFGHMRMISEALTHYRQHEGQVTRGTGNRSNAGEASLVAQRVVRAEQLHYCEAFRQSRVPRPLISGEQMTRRLNQIKSASCFLRKRAEVATSPRLHRMALIPALLFSGAYARYASGLRSAARDLLAKVEGA